MKYFKWFLIGFILTQSAFCNAQKISKVRGHYQYEGLSYTFSELGSIFTTDYDAYRTYTDAQAFQRLGKNFGIASLFALGLGSIIFTISDHEPGRCNYDYYCFNTIDLVAVSTIIAGQGLAITGLVMHIVSDHNRRQAIHQFNHRAVIGYQPPLSGHITYGVTTNGIGLSYTF